MSNDVVDALRRAVSELGWTEETLAQQAGLSTESASKIERGELCEGEVYRETLATLIGGLAMQFLFEPLRDPAEASTAQLEDELLEIMGENPTAPGDTLMPSALGLSPRNQLTPEALMRLSADLYRVAAAPTP